MKEYRKHRYEMIRFANSKDGVEVWHKSHAFPTWLKIEIPHWVDSSCYIIDDEYADIRMKSIDTGIPIQVYIEKRDEWFTMEPDMDFTAPVKYYRLKPKEFKYPIYKKGNFGGAVVRFTDLGKGTVVKVGTRSKCTLGQTLDNWVIHTDTSVWRDYDEQWEEYLTLIGSSRRIKNVLRNN